MFLSEYLGELTKIIDEYAKSGIILSSEVESDFRTEKIGLIKCKILFIDGSKLFFTEYLDLRHKIEKLTYSFHYQSKETNLIFRYDNATHRPSFDFVDHKHVGSEIYQSGTPGLRDVLTEIVSGIEI